MDRQAIDVHGRIAFSNANCALPKTVKSSDGGRSGSGRKAGLALATNNVRY